MKPTKSLVVRPLSMSIANSSLKFYVGKVKPFVAELF
jgi:hypothetical protein